MVNKVILVGNVGSDPEVRTFEDGGKMARVNIATNERIYNPSTQEWKDHTEWHTLTFGRRTANVVEMYVRKGSQIYVEGKLRTRQWEDENKIRRYSTEVSVDELRNVTPYGMNAAFPQRRCGVFSLFAGMLFFVTFVNYYTLLSPRG